VDATIAALGATLNVRDCSTHAHSQRVISYALALGRILGLSELDLLTLRRGVFLHDIGKIHVPETILNKPGHLTEVEWSIMRRHPVSGYKIVRSTLSSLEEVAKIVLAHHEWYDGTGYPYGLKGEEIPLGARICSVVDVLDALTSDRPYREPLSFAEASAHIRSERETHFDPLVVEAFLCITPAQWQRLQLSANQDLPCLLLPPRETNRLVAEHFLASPVF
jgi:putative nucleotidyltransferase with HDIG domain